MRKYFAGHKLFHFMCLVGALGFSSNAMAAAFQLWEQDAASIGNYHAGRAAIADDASTAYYNPAGLVNIKNQQLVLGGDPIMTDFRYHGTVAVNTLLDQSPQGVAAQGGSFNFVPFGHYAAPVNNNLVIAISAVVPFGLKTDYGSDTILRYAATLTSINVLDVTPSLGYAINDKLSVGLGADIEHIKGDFNQEATALDQTLDTSSNNSGSDTAYGYHLGVLYNISPQTRIGVSYHSQVVHHLKGHSDFIGPLANGANGGTQSSTQLMATATLPPTTSVSLFHNVNPTWDVMGTVTLTQWSVFKQLVLLNTAGVLNEMQTNTLPIIVQEDYHNSWNFAVGSNYHASEKWTWRAGLGYDQTPSTDRYRNVQLPDSDKLAVSVGGHYQATSTIGFDAGWTHLFVVNTRINNLSQTVGDETVTTNGSVSGNADVFGLQVKWDFT